MADDPMPDDVRSAQFRTVFRGVDGSEVSAYLDTLADELDALTQEKERLEARLGEYADRDLRSEFDNLGREVSAVLQAAREAAESMRERASLDAAKWRSEAMAEADGVRRLRPPAARPPGVSARVRVPVRYAASGAEQSRRPEMH